MRRISFCLLTCFLSSFLALTACAAKGTAAAEKAPESVKERSSYAMGVVVARSMKHQQIEPDLAFLMKGLQDVFAGGDLALDDAQIQQAMSELEQEARKNVEATRAAQSSTNKQAGAAFLAENAKAEGVVTTASGLQYKVLVEGTGKKPAPTDRVTVNYEGRTITGEVIDSSYTRGQPATFALNQVIGGWTEGVGLMSVGSKYQLCVPPELAYGSTPPPGARFGPDSVLVFDIELVGIE